MNFYHMLGAGRFPLHIAKIFQKLTSQERSEILRESQEESVDNNFFLPVQYNFKKHKIDL